MTGTTARIPECVPAPALAALLAGFLAASLLAGCQARSLEPRPEEMARKVVPAAAGSGRPEREGERAEEESDPDSQPRVPLDRDETLIEAVNANLDLDPIDEQILILGRKGEAESPIRVAVVDYDSVRDRYARSWESQTQATNARTFSLTLKDIVGDHNLDLVCRGTRSSGEITLDVFRKTPSPSGLGLYFAPICQIVADGSIEIQEVERSEGYQLGQKNGPSFPIFAYTQDKESRNILDLVKYSYHWKYQENRYVLTSQEKVPGEVVKEKQLADLFSSRSVGAFEQYLAGPWYRPATKGEQEETILFLPDDRIISIYSGNTQEIYLWQESYRMLSNRLTIVAENESIQSLNKRIFVEVKSSNSIVVTIIGSESWDSSTGTYVKLGEELQRKLLAGGQQKPVPETIRLAGLYRSREGAEIIFEPPRFTWLEGERVYAGGFNLFYAGDLVLCFKGLNESGLPTGDRVYTVKFSQAEDGGQRVRTLVLTPGRLSVRGVEPVTGEERIFQQIEQIEGNGSKERARS